MKYKSCIYVNHCLGFNDSRVVYCTLGNTAKNKQYPVLIDNYNGEPIDWEKLLDKIDADKQSHRNGVIIDSCKDCLMLEDKDWDEETEPRKFKYILFSNWYACNSACRYCWKDEKDFLIEDVDANSKINPNDTYDIIPIVRDLIDKNLLTDDATVDFAGGEPTMYYKFDEALKMFIDAKIKHIIINTNAIIYSDAITKAIAKGVAEVVVSIDAGTKEVHQKVKRVASFDRVLENFAKYCSAKQPKNSNSVCSKYIIVPHLNDSKEEIKKWLDFSKEMNATELIINADDRMFMHKPDLDDFKIVKDLCDYFINEAKKENVSYRIYGNAINIYTTLGLTPPDSLG